MSDRSRTWWKNWGGLAFLGGMLLFVGVVPLYRNGPPIRSDGLGYHLWTRALLEGDPFFRNYPHGVGIYPADPARGTFQNKFPPGVALVRFPVMALLVKRTPQAPISRGEHVACLVLAALACLGVGLCCLHAAALLGAPAAARNAALLTVTFGTGLFHYATYDASFSHIWSALGVALLACLSVRAVTRRRPSLPLLPTAVLCALLLLIRNTNLLALVLLTGAHLAWRRRDGSLTPRGAAWDLAAVLVGVGLGIGAQVAYNSAAHGRLVLSSYQGERFVWDRPMVLSVLVSYERGLFTYYPVLGVVVCAALLVRRTRRAAAWYALVLLAFAVLYGFWWSWPLGMGFGHRGFVELTPLAVMLFAYALDELRGRWRYAIGGSAIMATLLTLQLMLGYWRGSLPGEGTRPEVYWLHAVGRKSLLRYARIPIPVPQAARSEQSRRSS
jgi:hypothetical protein